MTYYGMTLQGGTLNLQAGSVSYWSTPYFGLSCSLLGTFNNAGTVNWHIVHAALGGATFVNSGTWNLNVDDSVTVRCSLHLWFSYTNFNIKSITFDGTTGGSSFTNAGNLVCNGVYSDGSSFNFVVDHFLSTGTITATKATLGIFLVHLSLHYIL